MPRKVGYKCSNQARENMRNAAKTRKSKLGFLYGFTQEYIDEQRAAGKSWCSDCKTFHSEGSGRRIARCKSCNTRRNETDYYARPEFHRKRRQEHYAANREAALRYRRFYSLKAYGVTPEWYERTLAKQRGGCAICGCPQENQQRQLAIDHDHRCCDKPRGKGACNKCRRGLLCDNCNRALERLESDPDWAEKALNYLANWQAVRTYGYEYPYG